MNLISVTGPVNIARKLFGLSWTEREIKGDVILSFLKKENHSVDKKCVCCVFFVVESGLSDTVI